MNEKIKTKIQRNKNENKNSNFMNSRTPYRDSAQVREIGVEKRANAAKTFRAIATVASIGLGVNGAIDYLRYDKELDKSKERVERIRNGAEDLREFGENLRRIGEYYQRDASRTIGLGRLIGMHRICTKYDSRVAVRLIGDYVAMEEIAQLRREMRELEVTIRREADKIENEEVLPSQKGLGNSMIYIGLAGLMGSVLYGTRKREDQE
jgi:hypothetical protein